MIRDTLSELVSWFSSDVASYVAKPFRKRKNRAQLARQPEETAKRKKRRAQRQARARNR